MDDRGEEGLTRQGDLDPFSDTQYVPTACLVRHLLPYVLGGRSPGRPGQWFGRPRSRVPPNLVNNWNPQK